MNKESIILDTDMENEIDDKFALTYLLKSLDNFNLEAVTIAPFSGSKYSMANTIEEGTNESYLTTIKIMDMLNYNGKDKVYKGATKYFWESEESNEAAEKIIEIANKNVKTTILAIGALTNIGIAIKKEPKIIDKIKIIWLGGNSFLTKHNDELNFKQDIKAVQTVFNSGAELVIIPCINVASNLVTTIYELKHYLENKGEIGKYLLKEFSTKKKYEVGMGKTIWDISVIGYSINKSWFNEEEISCPEILDNGNYKITNNRHKVIFVNDIFRSKIYHDFFIKMGCKEGEI